MINYEDFTKDQVMNTRRSCVSIYNSILNCIDAKYITSLEGISDKEKARSIILEKTLFHIVREYLVSKDKYAKVFIVHRLDKDTSGLVVLAKDEKTKNKLQENELKIFVPACLGPDAQLHEHRCQESAHLGRQHHGAL